MKNNSGFGMRCPTTLSSPPIDAHESSVPNDDKRKHRI